MTFDSDAPQSKRFSYYGVDDIKTGQQTMAELAKLMGEKGKVAILAGNQNAPNLQHRVQGAKEEAAKHPGMTVIGTFNHVETPQDAAAEVVRVDNAYPDIQGWAIIGGWPLFTTALLKDLNPAKIKVASVDAMPAQLAYVDQGVVPVLLAQSVYLWGDVGVRTIVDKLHFQKDVPADDPDGARARVEGEPRRVGEAAQGLGLHRRRSEVPEGGEVTLAGVRGRPRTPCSARAMLAPGPRRSGGLGLRRLVAKRALLLEERDERASGAEDVIAHEPRRLHGVALARRGRDRAMLVPRARLAVRERELHAQIPVAVLVQLVHDAHRELAIGRRVERRVKLPIERAPHRDLAARAARPRTRRGSPTARA